MVEVIYDSGRGVPVAPYLTYLVNMEPAASEQVLPGLQFPLRTRLKPGVLRVAKQVFDPQWLAQPMFLVGDDLSALGWLQWNRWRLLRAGAWGLVVQAESPATFRALKTLAPELQFAPGGDWIDAQMILAGIDVYPVLIGLDGIAVQILTDAVYGPAAGPPKVEGKPS
jgi:integrating conjugative element protein (TIGR03765 family)